TTGSSMTHLTFYRQKRCDGGIHTGLSLNRETVLGHFEDGPDFSDPVLLWFVDVRVEGRRLPHEAEAIRQWFLDHSAAIQQGLREVAEEVRAGFEPDVWPMQRPLPRPPRGVRWNLVCCALRRFDALDISKLVLDEADHWQAYLRLPR